MSFSATMRKYERYVLLVLVIFTASVFTVTFECAQMFSRSEESNYAGKFYYGEEEVGIDRVTFEDILSRWKSAKFLWSFVAMGSMDALSSEMLWSFVKESGRWGEPVPFWYWFESQDTPRLPGAVEDKQPLEDERLRKTVWNIVVLLDECKRTGISTSDAEVRDYIQQSFQPFMGRDEQQKPRPFNPDVYVSVVSTRMKLEPEAYEQTIREYLTLNKLRNTIQEAVVVSDEAIFKEFMDQHQQVLLHAVRFDPSGYKKPVYHVSDEVLSEHFRLTQARYMQQEMVSFEYVFAAIEDLRSKLTEPTAEDLNFFYEGHKEEFYKQATPNPATDKSPTPGENPPSSESKPSTPEKPTFKSFEEVRDDVRKRWLDRKANEVCFGEIRKFLRELEAAVLERDASLTGGEKPQPIPLEPIATKVGLCYGVTRFIPIGRMAELSNLFGETAAWPDPKKMSPDSATDRIATSNGSVVLRLSERIPADARYFVPELRKKVEEDYKRSTEESAACNAASAFHATLAGLVDKRMEEAGLKDIPSDKLTEEQRAQIRDIKLASFTEAALREGKDVLKTGFVKPSDDVEEFKGQSGDILSRAVATEPGVFRIENLQAPFSVWQLRAKRPPQPSEYESQRKSIGDSLFQKTGATYIRAWEEAIVKEARLVDYIELARKRAK